MKKYFLLLALFCASVCASCEKDESKEVSFSLKTPDENNPALLSFSEDVNSKQFTVETNSTWKVEKRQADGWVTIKPDHGNGNGTIVISATANTLTSPRQAELTFFANDQKRHTLTVKQGPKKEQQFHLTVKPGSPQVVSAKGGFITLTVTTNVEAWEYAIKGENTGWLSEKTKNATSITLTAVENLSESKQTAAVEFTAPGYPDLRQTVEIAQNGVPGLPKADLLDVVFNNNGTAVDASPMNIGIQKISGSAMMTYYNDSYERYTARFNHTPGAGVNSGYYKADYAANLDFQNALSDGHSMEALFMFDADPQIGKEIKMFSSMQAGGTGFLLAKEIGEITFLLNLSQGGWQWVRSGVVAEKGKYYHVVGVWDKQSQKAHIYVNGALKSTIDAKGDFKFPNAQNCYWFGIGGDAGPSAAEAAWKGDVAIARIYGDPLPADQVARLWDQVKNKQPQTTIQISEILFLSGFEVKAGSQYRISGKGFASGDEVRLESLTNEQTVFNCNATATASYIDVEIPAGFVSGEYRMVLIRENATYPLGVAVLTLSDNPTGLKLPRVIAHRGYHTVNGAPQNSVASLKGAQQLGIYGSESDFYITKDGVVVVHHDPTINGVTIENADYSDIKNMTLSNNEKLPTLAAFLDEIDKDPNTRLVLEIKSHKTDVNNDRAVDAIVSMVSERSLTGQVDYIAFSYHVCQRLAEKVPAGTVIGYLNGDKAPTAIAQGINCIDYQMNSIRNNPQWIKDAHARGMTVNVWTVNSEQDMMDFIAMGVDFITTDYPDKLNTIIEKLSK